MAELVLKDVKIIHDTVDVSGDHNQISITASAEMLDKTTYGSSGKKRVAGLTDAEVTGQGFTNVAKSEPEYSGVGTTGVLSVGTSGGAVGETGYMMQTAEGSFAPFNGGAVGDVLPFDVQFSAASQPLIRGKVLYKSTSIAASAAGTAVNLGAVSTGESLYGALHITGASTVGSDIRVSIQTDSSSGFGSPTTQIAFTSSTGTTAEWGTRKDGAITDTWARANIGITSSSKAYSVFVTAGIK